MAFTDEELEKLGHSLVPTFQRLEHTAITTIASLMARLTGHISKAEERAQSMLAQGASRRETQRTIAAELNSDWEYQTALRTSNAEYRRIFTNGVKAATTEALGLIPGSVSLAATTAFSNDAAFWKEGTGKALQDDGFINGLANTRSSQLSLFTVDVTKSLAFNLPSGGSVPARDAFLRHVEIAFNAVTTGDESYLQANRDAIRTLGRSGLKTVSYPSGRKMNLDSAVRLNVLTTFSQLSGEITMHNVQKTGVDHVEISAHSGARHGIGSGDHFGWQGKVYQVVGSSPEYRNLEEATGYPSDPTGLYGYYCRHQMYPFWPGISEPIDSRVDTEPIEYGGKSYDPTQASDRQREMERKIRALKREAYGLDALGDKAWFTKIARKIRSAQAEYRRFSNAMGLRPKTERLWVDGFNRSVSSKATWATRRQAQQRH